MPEPTKLDIDRLVFEKHPKLRLVQLAAQTAASLYAGKESAPDFSHDLAKLEAARADFLAMPQEQLIALIAASRDREQAVAREREAKKQANRDASRFYNQPKVKADYGYWCGLPYWTLDEAAALLLGRDPHAVNPETLQRELTQRTGMLGLSKPPERAAFHQSFERLRTLLARAEGLNVERLQPGELIAWVQRTQAVQLPAKLASLIPQISEAVRPVAEPESSSAQRRAGTPKEWDAVELAKLKQYRAAHGTKAAAGHFGISPARVRQLLPGEAKTATPGPASVNSVFHRLR